MSINNLPVRPKVACGHIGNVLHGLCDVELEEEPVTHDAGYPDAEMGPLTLTLSNTEREAEDRAGSKPGGLNVTITWLCGRWDDLHKHLEIYTWLIFSMHLFHIKVNDIFYIKLWARNKWSQVTFSLAFPHLCFFSDSPC